MLDSARLADEVEDRLRAVGTRERAEGEQRYLKSDLQFLGANVGQVRREVKALAKGELDHDELVGLSEALWSKPIHERRAAAAFLLDARVDLLSPDDVPLLERLIRESRTWALVDVLAGDALGALILRAPAAAEPLDAWARDDDFWIRRSALLAWRRPLKVGAPLEPFVDYADAMLDEREFFIRKAIGWVLREVGRQRPDEVFDWLAPRTQRASGVTVREAVKYLAPAQREALLEAYRERRPARAG